MYYVVMIGLEPMTAFSSERNSKPTELHYYFAEMENYDISTYRLTADCSTSELHLNIWSG